MIPQKISTGPTLKEELYSFHIYIQLIHTHQNVQDEDEL